MGLDALSRETAGRNHQPACLVWLSLEQQAPMLAAPLRRAHDRSQPRRPAREIRQPLRRRRAARLMGGTDHENQQVTLVQSGASPAWNCGICSGPSSRGTRPPWTQSRAPRTSPDGLDQPRLATTPPQIATRPGSRWAIPAPDAFPIVATLIPALWFPIHPLPPATDPSAESRRPSSCATDPSGVSRRPPSQAPKAPWPWMTPF